MFNHRCAAVIAILALSAAALATPVQVAVYGTVDFNSISNAPMNGFIAGAPATLTFSVDSNNFVNSGSFPTRGYPIDQASFALSSGAASIGLQNPFPAGQVPYFGIRNNDPAVDGFFLGTSVDFDNSVPLNQTHTNGQRYSLDYSVTYPGDRLASLDILGALGTYDYTGLSVFNWGVWRISPDFVFMGLNYGYMTITPEPTALALCGILAAAIRRR